MFFLKELPSREMLKRYKDRFPNMDLDKTEQALCLLRKASFLIRELDRYFATNGLSQTRFYILIVLEREPNLKSLSMIDFAKRLDVSKPVITNTLKALEKENLVEIVPSKTDARVKIVTITERGRDVLRKVLPGYYAVINEHIKEDNHA